MSGWIGVDLDGTLAFYDGWKAATHIGDPVPKMQERVLDWLNAGREVRIFTARVSTGDGDRSQSTVDESRATIERWCEKHLGRKLVVTCCKDFGMVELWDDRCVQVQPNTGEPVSEFWKHSL